MAWTWTPTPTGDAPALCPCAGLYSLVANSGSANMSSSTGCGRLALKRTRHPCCAPHITAWASRATSDRSYGWVCKGMCTKRLLKALQPAPGESRLLWGAQRVRAQDAALVNGTAAHALAIAASHAGGLIANFGSDTKPLHAGRAAQSGVFAAAAAAHGFTGAADALEHPKGLLNAISPTRRADRDSPSEAGRVWKIARDGLNIKKYPACFYGHRAMDGLRVLLHAHDVRPEQVTAITVHTSARNQATLRYERPRTALEAKFSMQFAMAAALLARRVGLAEVTDAFVQREDVQKAMRTVQVVAQAADDPRRPGEAVLDSVVVQTRDGRRLQQDVEFARGNAAHPLREEELFAKLAGCLEYGGIFTPTRPLFDALLRVHEVQNAAEIDRLA